jgi:hypothetical protein
MTRFVRRQPAKPLIQKTPPLPNPFTAWTLAGSAAMSVIAVPFVFALPAGKFDGAAAVTVGVPPGWMCHATAAGKVTGQDSGNTTVIPNAGQVGFSFMISCTSISQMV